MIILVKDNVFNYNHYDHWSYICRLPGVSYPNRSLMSSLLKDAFLIAMVIFSISVSVGKATGHHYGYKINTNQVSRNFTILFVFL